MNNSIKKITTISMFCTLAFISVVVVRIPMILPFLSYEPKDVIIALGSFILGPTSAIIMTVAVSFVEMITISSTAYIGLTMNVLATVSFVLPGALLYRKNRNIKSVSIGLIIGTLLMTIVMLSWNYFLAPIFMKFPREEVVKLLIPAFLPFNLIKGGINTAITILLYKPFMNVFRKSKLFSLNETELNNEKSTNTLYICLAIFIIITCILYLMSLKGII